MGAVKELLIEVAEMLFKGNFDAQDRFMSELMDGYYQPHQVWDLCVQVKDPNPLKAQAGLNKLRRLVDGIIRIPLTKMDSLGKPIYRINTAIDAKLIDREPHEPHKEFIVSLDTNTMTLIMVPKVISRDR